MMSLPTLHTFEHVRDEFPEIQLSDSWGMTTSKSDDVIWNIVLAYLNSFPLSDKNELKGRIKCLTGSEKVNENIKRSIEICNPFLHRDACFSDKEIYKLVKVFKERVEDDNKRNKRMFHIPAKNFKYLEASSKLLNCNIVLISFPFKDEILVNVFPVSQKNHKNHFRESQKTYSKHILILDELIFTSKKGNPQEKFSFCIPEEIGIEKQKHALTEILKRSRMFDNKEKILQRVTRLPDITEDFLISLLKNDLWQVILFIYKSPYVLSKLADAGFETDPRRKDRTGKSAFFYALKTEESAEGKSGFFEKIEKSQLVFLLHDYAANACLQTDASVRSPDAVIVENLLSLKDHFELLGKDKEMSEVSEKSRCLFRDLCRFNEFQIEMCKSINEIRLEYYGKTNKEDEASQRKKTILTILETYETHFYYINGESEPSVDAYNNSRFKEFLEYKYYFDKLDFSSIVMFFDNLFLLKERLKLTEENAYLDVESNFFLFVFFRKYLKQYQKQKRFYFLSQLMSFQERLSLQRQMCSFKEILKKAELSDENIVNKIPKAAIPTLTNLPEIYGQFIILRLQHYLKAATELTVKDLKSILVVERCLQVIGECCEESEFKSVRSILILSLSKDFSKRLNGIRHSLSHIESHELFYRKKLEQDVELFIEIQKELIKLTELLRPIYSFHKYELNQFLLSYSVKSINKCRGISILEERENQLKATLTSSEMEESELSIPSYSCQNPRESYFQDMHSSLNEELNNLNSNGKILQKNTVSLYKRIVQNVISAIEEVLKNIKFSLPKEVVELESHFWCLENILTYITTDRKLAKYRRTLILLLEERNSLFAELREKACQFQKINKPTNSVIVEPPVAERDTVSKHLLSEPEDDRKQTNGSISLETIVTKECEEVSDHRENAEDPETITQTEENHLSFVEASTLRDDRLPANVYHDCPVKGEAEGLREIKGVKRNFFIEYAAKFLDNYKGIAHSIFQQFPDDSNKDFHFKNIENYCLKLKRKTILKDSEKEFVLRSVAEKFRNVPELKREIRALLREKVEFTEELNNKLSTLKLKNREIKEIKRELKRGVTEDTLRTVDLADDHFLYLREVMESEKLYEKDHEKLCEKLELSDAAKKVLSQLVPVQKVGSGQRLEFLRNRIKMLKKILIDEQDAIKQLWESETTSNGIIHVKEKIVHLYLKDFELQASVETLLFHCMTISRNNTLEQLWKKATNLFSGINLRNVLAHGHPLLESLGTLINPYDLPSELVGKMLQLISDEHIIYCMQQMVELSGTDYKGFKNIMEDEKNEQFEDLRKQILECDRWKLYAVLIPVDPNKKGKKKGKKKVKKNGKKKDKQKDKKNGKKKDKQKDKKKRVMHSPSWYEAVDGQDTYGLSRRSRRTKFFGELELNQYHSRWLQIYPMDEIRDVKYPDGGLSCPPK